MAFLKYEKAINDYIKADKIKRIKKQEVKALHTKQIHKP